MSHPQKPNKLTHQGRTLNFAGPSRTPGGALYVNHAEGTLVELYLARITRTGLHFSLAQIDANPHLGPVRISAPAFAGRPVIIGTHYLVGPLQFTPRPQASLAFPLNDCATLNTKDSRRRELGTVTEVREGYGFIKTDRGQRVFVHGSQLERGAQLLVGMRVSLEVHNTAKGTAAQFVRPSAS